MFKSHCGADTPLIYITLYLIDYTYVISGTVGNLGGLFTIGWRRGFGVMLRSHDQHHPCTPRPCSSDWNCPICSHPCLGQAYHVPLPAPHLKEMSVAIYSVPWLRSKDPVRLFTETRWWVASLPLSACQDFIYLNKGYIFSPTLPEDVVCWISATLCHIVLCLRSNWIKGDMEIIQFLIKFWCTHPAIFIPRVNLILVVILQISLEFRFFFQMHDGGF